MPMPGKARSCARAGPPRFAMALAVLAGLAGCAEVELASHVTKELQEGRDRSGGVYKVGKPYKIDDTWYYPRVDYNYDETGIASWYGPGFDGNETANGEIYDQEDLTAAHRTLPLPSMVRVTNLENGRSLRLRVNDRGPFSRGRIIDVSRRAAELLGFETQGTARVRVVIVENESRQLAALASGGEGEESPAPAAAPTVSVSVSPLGATAEENGSDLDAAAQPLSDNVAIFADTPLPQPDGVVTIEPIEDGRLYVQAGSFLYYHNANRLRAILSGLGPVFVDPAVVEGKHFFRVRFGPLASVGEADQLMSVLLSNGYRESRIVVD